MAKLIYGYLSRQPPLMKQSMTTLLFIWVFWYLFMQGEKKVVDRFLTFLILTRYRKICCNTNRRKTFETFKAARRGPAFAVLDCKSIYDHIYCFVILLEIFSQLRPPSFTGFEVTWHLTIKRLRKRHLKRWIRAASNFATVIPRSIRTVVVIFFWSWILKDYFEVQEKEKKVVVFVHILDKTWNLSCVLLEHRLPFLYRLNWILGMMIIKVSGSRSHHFLLRMEFLMRSSDYIIVTPERSHDSVREIALSIQEIFEEKF